MEFIENESATYKCNWDPEGVSYLVNYFGSYLRSRTRAAHHLRVINESIN